MVLSPLVLSEEQDHVSDRVKDFAELEDHIVDEGAWVKHLNVVPDVDADLFQTSVANLSDRICVIEHVQEAPPDIEELSF